MRSLICICCPKGCHLEVDEEKKEVKGNSCPRGKEYGLNEVINPVRVITSTVKINNASLSRLPVKTSKPISKSLIMDVMKVIEGIEVSSPVKAGDKLVENVLNTGSDIIACRSL